MIESNVILVVQYAEDERTHTCNALRDKGYDTIGVESVDEALAYLILSCGNVRLVLSENQLPDYSAFELKAKLQELPEIKHMPVAFLDKHLNPILNR